MSSTLSMLMKLFDNDMYELEEIADMINRYGTRFGVNTPLRVAHFLAQVREEVGPILEPVSENLNYSANVLPKVFRAFRDAPELAERYGRTDVHSADKEMIANIAYADRLGNGDVDSGDGWAYRGRFFLQVTGKSNYEEVQKRIDRYLPNSGIDILRSTYMDDIEVHLVASMAYWIWKDLYRDADKGIRDDDVDGVTAKINKYTDSYYARREHFSKVVEYV